VNGSPAGVDEMRLMPGLEIHYEDKGTRLMVTFCRGKTYACFSQRNNENGVVEWFRPQNYLFRYKNQFNGDMLDEVLKLCDELGDWCSKDDNISRHQLQSGQAVNHSGGQADNEAIHIWISVGG